MVLAGGLLATLGILAARDGFLPSSFCLHFFLSYSGSIAARSGNPFSRARSTTDGDLRFGDLERIDAAEPLALRVHHHHDPKRLGRLLVKDAFENLHDEVHRRVVVVQQQHFEEFRLLELLPRALEDLSPVWRLVSAMRFFDSTKEGRRVPPNE